MSKEEATKKEHAGKVFLGGALAAPPEGSQMVDGQCRERRLTVNGANYEHVDDDPVSGVWRYRQMQG